MTAASLPFDVTAQPGPSGLQIVTTDPSKKPPTSPQKGKSRIVIKPTIRSIPQYNGLLGTYRKNLFEIPFYGEDTLAVNRDVENVGYTEGPLYWECSVVANLLKYSWNHIAIRKQPNRRSQQKVGVRRFLDVCSRSPYYISREFLLQSMKGLHQISSSSNLWIWNIIGWC